MKNTLKSVAGVSLLFGLGFLVTHFFPAKEQAQPLSLPAFDQTKATTDFGKIPLYFEPNVGQTDDQVDFMSRGQGYTLFLTDGEAVLSLTKPQIEDEEIRQRDVLRLQLLDANQATAVRGQDWVSGKSNYFIGDEPEKWHTEVPHYAKVKYDNIYQGIDLVYYGTEQRLLEHDFVVSPGADPNQIRFAVTGAQEVSLDDAGNLIAETDGGDVVLQAPITYQEIDGKRIPVDSRYALLDGSFGFVLGDYDDSHTVVIDPVLSYSTYLGGSSGDTGYSIFVDGTGHAYVTGSTESTNFPTVNAYDSSFNSPGGPDIFVTKFAPDGQSLIFSTFIGGSAGDVGWDGEVSSGGDILVVGNTGSTDFPLLNAVQPSRNGTGDAVVLRLNSAGNTLVFSTYLGGSGAESAGLGTIRVATDATGNAYVSHSTNSTDYPTTAGAFQTSYNGGPWDIVVTKFDASGNRIYGTYVGGGGDDQANDIEVDPAGHAYITGFTTTSGYPTAGSPVQPTYGGAYDAVFTKLHPSGASLVYSTYLGGSGDERGHGLALDSTDNVYIVGLSSGTMTIVGSVFQPTYGGGLHDIFVTKIDSVGSAIVFSSYLGGSGQDDGGERQGIAVDTDRNIYISSATKSTDFLTVNAFQNTYGGGAWDAVAVKINSSGSALLYSTYLGGAGAERAFSVDLDPSGDAYLTGEAFASDYPVANAFQAHQGGSDAFVTKLTPAPLNDVAASAGVNSSAGDLGLAWADYDGDGDQDVYVASRVANKLYRNNNNGTFTDVASGAGVASTLLTNSVAWMDYDNDGDLDVYLANGNVPNVLYQNNGSGVFTPIPGELADTGNGSGQAWADFDKDGDLDVYVGNFGSALNRLYRNNNNGTFTDIASATGLNSSTNTAGAAWGDYDNDGDPDLYVVHVGSTNQFYRNDGNASFANVTGTASVGDSGGGRGVMWGDIDNDGDLDLYAINAGSTNKMYQNNGNGTFTSTGGVVENSGSGTGGSLGDYDNDGDLDLHLVRYNESNILFNNSGAGSFTDATNAVGVGDSGKGFDGHFVDYDNDGDLDIYVVNDGDANVLFRNDSVTGNWLHVDLTGTTSPDDAMGAQINVYAGATTLRRWVDTGSGYNAQPPHLVHFGLGSAFAIDSVVVKWPSGIEQERYNVGINQVLQLTEANEVFVSIPDTVANYSSTVHVPVRIDEDVTGKSIVSAEILVAYDNSVVTPGSPDKTLIAGTMVASGWSVEENVLSGVGGIDTLTIAMSTAVDTLTGTGDLILLVFDVANIRQPTSTALTLTTVVFNDNNPVATKTDGSITVIGTDAAISASPDSIRPSESVSITLDDVDLDLDVGVVEQVSVTAFSVTYGDSQYVTLTETGVNTGSFTGSVSTEFSAVAGTPQDGVIGTIAGDSIGVVATDVLTSAGITSPLYVFPVRVYGGIDGVVAVSYVVQALDGRNGVRDTVRVQVADEDLDLDVGVANQVSATITNAISGETESVTLTETGVNTGVFQVRVPSIAGASGTNNDGVLSLASWDTLNVSYTDSLTSQGGVSPVGDITRVVNLFGDVQVNDKVQAFDAARLLAISVGLVSSNTQTTLVGDVDGGGVIQAFDASLALQYVVRLIDRFPVQTDFTADPKNHPFEKPVLNNVIALGTIEAQDDGTYLVPVQLAEREGVLSGTLTFGMDAGIEVVDVDLTNAYGSFMIAHNTTDEGVKVAFAGSQSNLSGSGDVLMLRVRGVEGAPIRLSLDQVSLNGQSLTPSVNIEAMETVEIPASAFITELHQNLPNPFNPQTTIRYGLADAGQVSVVIYSVTGQRVRTLVSAFQESGAYQVTWDGLDALGHQVSSGVYLMRMQTGGFIQTRKMLLLR